MTKADQLYPTPQSLLYKLTCNHCSARYLYTTKQLPLLLCPHCQQSFLLIEEIGPTEAPHGPMPTPHKQ
jgi:hypothetical protein